MTAQPEVGPVEPPEKHVRTCIRCGLSMLFMHAMPDVVVCKSCATVPEPKGSGQGSPNVRLAREVTVMRLAIEMARSALILGKYDAALKHLDTAKAPTKRGRR